MRDNLLKIIRIISAIYYNYLATDTDPGIFDQLKGYIKDIIIDVRATEGNAGGEDRIVDNLRATAEWMLSDSAIEYSIDDLLMKLKLNLLGDLNYYGILEQYLNPSIAAIDARKRVHGIMQELRYEEQKVKLKKTVWAAHKALTFSGEYVETPKFVNDLLTELEDIQVSGAGGDHAGLVGKVDFTDVKAIEEALTKGVDLLDINGVLNTGFQGLNAACNGMGVPRGYLVNFGALTHHYKTGMLIDLSLNIPAYNDPWLWDKTKKALIIRVSFENTIDQDIITMYKKLYECKHGVRCDVENITMNEAVATIEAHFSQRGYTFQMLHYDPATFCVYDLFDLFNKYIEAGYEIHAAIIDYLSQIASNTYGDRLDSKITKTFEMVRNFCYPKGITVFTGHQLSTEAQTEYRANPIGLTRKTCTGGWYMDCKSLHTKLDLEFVMCVYVHNDGVSYLFISRGKARGMENTPYKHRHIILPFLEIGGIKPDINGENITLYNLPRNLDESTVNVNWD
jgi:hypothetical protein